MTLNNELRYIPVLLRALELGNGPPGLDRWVCRRIYSWSVEDPSLARRLALELRSYLDQHQPPAFSHSPGNKPQLDRTVEVDRDVGTLREIRKL